MVKTFIVPVDDRWTRQRHKPNTSEKSTAAVGRVGQHKETVQPTSMCAREPRWFTTMCFSRNSSQIKAAVHLTGVNGCT